MKTISELASYYRTDKMKDDGCHNYAQYYDIYFSPLREKVEDIVEIGILNHPNKAWCPNEGASILMWNDYFTNAQIHGIDIIDHTGMDKHGSDRINIHIADQGDRLQLKYIMENKIGRQVDIIIDDGSHMMKHQQISLGFLFQYLKPGGIFVIEDLHTSHPQPPFPPMCCQDSPNDTLTEDMLFDYIKTKKINSIFMTDNEIKYLEENIKECILEQGAPPTSSRIAFIFKK